MYRHHEVYREGNPSTDVNIFFSFSINLVALHNSCTAQAISKFTMPAMSPTMTEGGLASWKVKEGDTFAAGDVLLEIVSVFKDWNT